MCILMLQSTIYTSLDNTVYLKSVGEMSLSGVTQYRLIDTTYLKSRSESESSDARFSILPNTF